MTVNTQDPATPVRNQNSCTGRKCIIPTFMQMYTQSSHLIIMWWQLVEKLLDSELLSRTVDIGNLIFWQAGEI